MFKEDIREEIENTVEYLRESMPPEIKTAISRLNADLYNGPLYFDADGESCSCFDEGAKAFNFSEAGKIVRKWADDTINDIKIEVAYDEENDDSFYESVDGSAREIARAILGKELNSTI